ncbi:hypothetical protein ACA910_003514 [Epithemia clementina (nom. ined.)]
MSTETLATVRWMSVTVALGVTAYTVANAIPFFQDLVALIGAVTVVPLTLLLLALYWRKEIASSPVDRIGLVETQCQRRLAVVRLDWIVFSLLFMVTATVGVLNSISQDWENHGGRPFECI